MLQRSLALMIRSLCIATLATLLLAGSGAATGCAIEDLPGGPDAGDTDGDDYKTWPKGPYGTSIESTIANFQLEECFCGQTGVGQTIFGRDFLDAKAMLISVHAGWCSPCKQQIADMSARAATYNQYIEQGLAMILIYYQDENYDGSREALIDLCCREKEHFKTNQYNVQFLVAIDPELTETGKYGTATPLNMVVNKDMTIKFKELGWSAAMNAPLQASIEKALAE